MMWYPKTIRHLCHQVWPTPEITHVDEQRGRDIQNFHQYTQFHIYRNISIFMDIDASNLFFFLIFLLENI
jgi:hypothetical protein